MCKWKLVFTPDELTHLENGVYDEDDDFRGCKTEISLSYNQTIRIILLQKDDEGFWKMPDIRFESKDYTTITIKTFFSNGGKGQEILDDYIVDQSGREWHLDNCIVRI